MPQNIAKEDLVNAKAKHYYFKSKMRAYLEGSIDISEEILSDHNVCGLGKWINDVGKVRYGIFHEIEELDKIHQSIHATARHIIALKKEGNQERAEEEMKQINKIGLAIVQEIEKLETILSK